MKIKSNISRAHNLQRKSSSEYRWINLTTECKNCEFNKNYKQCTLGGIVRNIFTKGKIKNNCNSKLKI